MSKYHVSTGLCFGTEMGGSQHSKPLSETVRLSIRIHSMFYGLPSSCRTGWLI